jgi:toxin CptA
MAHLRITIRSSTLLALGLCAAHFGAAAAIWLAAVPLWVKMGLSLGIAASLPWPLASQAALRAAEAIVALEITERGRLSFLTRGGKWRACELLGSTYVSPWLTILNLKPEGGRLVRHVVLVTDNVDARDFRRLRVWLRWGDRPGANRVY